MIQIKRKNTIFFYAAILTILSVFTALPKASDAAPENPEKAYKKMKKILSSPIYNRWRLRHRRNIPELGKEKKSYEFPESIKNLLNRIADWIAGLLKKKRYNNTSRNSASNLKITQILQLAAWILFAALACYLLLLLYRHIQDMKLDRKNIKVLGRRQVAEALEEGDALSLSSNDWLAESLRLENESSFRLAYRALYLSLLSGLHREHKIDFRKNLTNWSYVNFFKGITAEKNSFRQLTGIFDEVWYGEFPETNLSIDEARAEVSRLISPHKGETQT